MGLNRISMLNGFTAAANVWPDRDKRTEAAWVLWEAKRQFIGIDGKPFSSPVQFTERRSVE